MKNKLAISVGLFLVVIASRLLPHPANFAPGSALLLLFPGYSLVVLASLFVSDLLLGFHSTMIYVYASYVLIAGMGMYGRSKQRSWKFLSLPLFSAMLFYTVTNFGVWATTSMYTRDFSGLMQSYWMGIPFLRGTILGDVFFFSVISIALLVREGRQTKRLRVSI